MSQYSNNRCGSGRDSGWRNESNYRNDCDKNLKVDKLCACEVDAKKGCFDNLGSDELCTNDATTKRLSADYICASTVNAKVGSFQKLIANDVCFAGPVKAADFAICGKYRATAAYSIATTYSLNSPMSFLSVLDDPNGNLSFVPWSQYTAPYSGYYTITVQVNQSNLVPSTAILGNPVSEIGVYVNGILARGSYFAYIPFLNQQKNCFTTIISLQAGDIVTAVFGVTAISDTTGSYSVVGTVDLSGNGTEFNSTMIKIQLDSVTCTDMPVCAPSVPCELNECTPCEDDCQRHK